MTAVGARRVAMGALLLVGALLQIALFALDQRRQLAALPANVERFAAAEPRVPLNAQIVAYRTLPALARAIPVAAPTLLVTPIYDPIQFEFYFVPRPFRLLLRLPPAATVEQITREAPQFAHLLKMRHDTVHRRRIVWTAERFAEELAQAQYLVVFGWDDFDPAAAPQRLEPVARDGPAVLYRVQR